MKNTGKRIAAVVCALVLVCAVLAPTVYALDTFSDLLGSNFGDMLSELLGGMGGGGGGGLSLSDLLTDPNGALSQLRERLANLGVTATDGQIIDALKNIIATGDNTTLSALLNNNEMLNTLAQYLQNNGSTTLPTTEPPATQEPTTEPPTTEEPATEAPTTTPPTTAYTPVIIAPSTTYVYSGADPYTVTSPATTTTEPSFAYSEQVPSYTSQIVTDAISPVIVDDKGSVDDNNKTMKLVVGTVLLSVSAVAIIVVIAKMRKARV